MTLHRNRGVQLTLAATIRALVATLVLGAEGRPGDRRLRM